MVLGFYFEFIHTGCQRKYITKLIWNHPVFSVYNYFVFFFSSKFKVIINDIMIGNKTPFTSNNAKSNYIQMYVDLVLTPVVRFWRGVVGKIFNFMQNNALSHITSLIVCNSHLQILNYFNIYFQLGHSVYLYVFCYKLQTYRVSCVEEI